jgi:pyruvate-formate lyase-activating enzyme
MLRRAVAPIALSAPHYLHELKQIRTLSAFGNWVHFKFPFAFPFAPFTLYVTIELTTLCNLACIHCWRLSSVEERGIGSMPVGTFEKIIREISVAKKLPDVLKIGGHGEPVLHPCFEGLMRLLDLLRGTAVHTIVYTNGTLFERFSPQDITRWNIHRIVVSIDGIDPTSYESIRVGGNYHRLRDLVCEFRDFRDRASHQKPWMEIRHVIMEGETATQLLRFRRQWLPPGDTVKFQNFELGGREVRTASTRMDRGRRRELQIQWNGNVPIHGNLNRLAGSLESHTIEELWFRIRDSLRQHCVEAHAR